MSPIGRQRKTCNEVNIRQSLLLRAGQTRQSSTTRAASAQDGTTSAGCPLTLNSTRPRLKVIASSSGSHAARLARNWLVAGSKLAARLRVCALVQTEMKGAATLDGLNNVTDRAERTQRSVICVCPVELTKRA